MDSFLRILLIDDNSEIRSLVRDVLERAFPSLELTEVSDAKEFDRLLKKGIFDLAITDYQLGWSTGTNILQTVKSRFPDRPVIMFTASGNEEIAVNAMKAGLDDYIIKSPNHLLRLAPAIEQALARSREHREQKQAAAALQLAEKNYRSIFENAIEGIFQSTPAGVFTSVNPAMAAMFGFASPEEFISSIRDIGQQLYANPTRRAEFCRLMENYGEVRGFESEAYKRGMDLIWISENARAVRDDTGAIIYYEGMIQDISERKKAEEALRRERDFNKSILQSSPAFFVAISPQGKTMMMNESMLFALGFTLEEVVGCDFMMTFIPEKGRESFAKVFEQLVIFNRPTVNENYVLTKDGRELLIEWHGRPVLKDNEVDFVFGLGIDISERTRAENKIKTALQEKEALLKEIHHRVKNNLQVVSGLLNLQSSHLDDPKTKEILKESQNRIYSMALIHQQLYQSENLALIDMNKYIRSLLNNLVTSYFTPANTVMMKISIANVSLHIDKAVPLALIINELVSNTMKHAFPGDHHGHIRIELLQTAENGGHCPVYILTVADDGIGLPEGIDIENLKTLGLQLVSMLSKQIGGMMEMKNNHGTEISVKFAGD